MAAETTPNPGRNTFPEFPFDPYPIQTDFMTALYSALDKGGVALLESPTGTGKTMSVICSTLQWLVDQRRKPKKKVEEEGKGGEEDEPDWMRDFVAERQERKVVRRKEVKRIGFGFERLDKKVLKSGKGVDGDWDEEGEFLVEEYESEEEEGSESRGGKRKGAGSSSSEEEEEEEEMTVDMVPKVFFCSRTHSQLSQFVKEFKRTSFRNEVSLMCLGSRKNLCINPEVLKLKTSNQINERCLELQKNKNRKDSKTKVKSEHERKQRTRASSGCPMLRKQSMQKQFKDEVWQEAMDIEDLVQLGTSLGTCPYYGSRSMVPVAELVVLPYQSLLMKSARESLALNLKQSVVVIDEAHNLADSITNMYNSKITLSQLKQVYSHLEHYLDRFLSHLGAGNRRYIQTLMCITNSFIQILLEGQNAASFVNTYHAEKAFVEKPSDIVAMAINEFLFSLDIDNINLVKLRRYIKESNIIHKVSGYGSKLASLEASTLYIDGQNYNLEGTAVSGFQALVDVLLSLINNDPDGRIIISRQRSTCNTQFEEGYIKFVMLSADKIFSEIMDEVHAVVLTGGTLQPIEEARTRLFPRLPSDQMHFFSCNHIVPPESILPIIVCCGPSGMAFDFSYGSRSNPRMIDELGRLLCNLVTVVPEGIVVFFSSFEYEAQVYEAWRASGILERIIKKKHIFREPKSNTDIEHILKEYKETISSCSKVSRDGPHGAIFLAVVGGKVSEGINFSDGMGRCVLMVGLPYPSPSDVELMERIKHIDRLEEPTSPRLNKPLSDMFDSSNSAQSGFDILRSCKHKGKEYYENLCMKAVNQSIGRAIRHIDDYAAVLLVDCRYASNSLKANFSHPTDKLPIWIKERLVSSNGNYGLVHRLLRQFFQFNRQKGCS